MRTIFVCPLCSADRWSERFHVAMPGQGTLVLCVHAVAEIQHTVRLVTQGSPEPPDPLAPPMLRPQNSPGSTQEGSTS